MLYIQYAGEVVAVVVVCDTNTRATGTVQVHDLHGAYGTHRVHDSCAAHTRGGVVTRTNVACVVCAYIFFGHLSNAHHSKCVQAAVLGCTIICIHRIVWHRIQCTRSLWLLLLPAMTNKADTLHSQNQHNDDHRSIMTTTMMMLMMRIIESVRVHDDRTMRICAFHFNALSVRWRVHRDIYIQCVSDATTAPAAAALLLRVTAFPDAACRVEPTVAVTRLWFCGPEMKSKSLVVSSSASRCMGDAQKPSVEQECVPRKEH